MIRHIVKIVLALALAILVYSIGMPGCSSTQFGSLTLTCEDFPESYHCQTSIPVILDPTPDLTPSDPITPDLNPQKKYLEFNYDIFSGKVDIIFVIDNSSSMAQEHRSLANQFHSFLNHIKNVKYHIAVITTDISTSPDNPVRGAYYQDGKFINIAGQPFLRNETLGDNPSQQIVEAFQNAIVREETTRCDTKNQPQSSGNKYDSKYLGEQTEIVCPSHDERGTYALNLAIQNQQYRSFFRESAHLMLVVLSDEDVRSSEDYYNQPGLEHYGLEPMDRPIQLVENVKNYLGVLKSFSVYSIIIPPGHYECLNEQRYNSGAGSGTGRGYEGVQYKRLSKAQDPNLIQYGNLLEGEVISICNRNYGYQLKKVAIAATTTRMPLPCGQPKSIDLYINGIKNNSNYRIEGLTLIIEPKKISLGSKIQLKVICEE